MTIPRKSLRVMKRIRAKLRTINPHCHWCGVLTLETPAQPDSATVDHVKPRRECRSAEEYHAESNLVLACFECNQGRDVVDMKLLEHQRERQKVLDGLKRASRPVLMRTVYIG